MQLCDLIVAPSIYRETFGFSIAEAMGCQKPVVTSNVGGFPELVVDGVTGYIVKPFRVVELSGAIVKILSDDQKARNMGKSGRQRVAKHFTEKKMVKAVFRSYEEALKKERIAFSIRSL